MLDNHQANEDLKAFERRLTEILACYRPKTNRWRIVLLLALLTTSITAFQWLSDPRTEQVPFQESLSEHWFFATNCLGLIILFITGIHRKIIAPTIIVSRIRSVLENFNMSCDQNGRLIINRATTTTSASITGGSFEEK